MKQYTRPPFPLRPVKNHEVGPVVVSRSGNVRGGEYVYSEGERYDNVERSTRDVSVGEERKKMGGGRGGCEGCPRKNRKFCRVVEIRGAVCGEEDEVDGGKGLG